MRKIIVLLLLSFFIVGCEYLPVQVKEFKINYVTNTDQEIGEQLSGKIDTLPILTSEESNFKGWFFEPDFITEAKISNITTDVTLYAKWETKQHTVFFIGRNGNVLSEQLVNHLEAAIAPEVTDAGVYNFIEWDKPFASIMEDTIIYGIYSISVLTVDFYDYNGVLIVTYDVIYGSDFPTPNAPTREGYVFNGWDVVVEKVTSNLVATATYLKSNTSIIFNTDGGNAISSIKIQYGEMMNLPTPIKTNSIFFKWINQDGFEVINNTKFSYNETITLKAVWLEDYYSKTTLVKYLYNQSHLNVKMPTDYVRPTEDFRGVWVSHITSDISRYSSKSQMMDQLTTLLNNLESWNMNALIYHVRTHNDAFYPSENNPIASYLTAANFEEWDYLEWLIAECHDRGIEFHAWMNPYRVSSGTNVSTITSKYSDYPNNPASQAKYLLTGASTILNPGEPYVREFLVDTVLEFVEKYNVDAVHFDDYFYISGINDDATFNQYKGTFTNRSDWRREQVDIFIEDLSISLRAFNKTNNKNIELGISPSGIYRNGNGEVTYKADGTAITNGSATIGMEHYAGYLFSDSKRWIDEEWIDYIVPQSYWGFLHKTAAYASVIDWWAKVVKNKNVKLYAGMGIYMEQDSWLSNPYEASDQVLYNSKLPEVQGTVIFRYGTILNKINTLGVQRLFNEYWTDKIETPK